MAKSIRSKSKRKFRAIKREQVFAPVENARMDRLSASLNSGTDMQAESEEPVVEADSVTEAVAGDVTMEDTTGNKISLKKKEEKKKKKSNEKQPRQIKRVQLQKKKKAFKFHRK
ncbi:hypothetical protein K7432_001926 [Basidiobolus ranarum]|uniref:DUF2423 domain-containing protein n=1 Tax=Basidiobolus ranarum TaxID=34480 RepID=A0ABR2W9F6_9FUNG